MFGGEATSAIPLNTTADHSAEVNFSWYCNRCLTPFLFCFGFVGNSIAIFLLTRRHLWSCLNYYLIALASWDIALLVGVFFGLSVPPVPQVDDVSPCTSAAGTHFLQLVFILMDASFGGCKWTLVCTTVERYRAISSPLAHRTRDNDKIAKLALLAVSVLSILFSLPRLAEWEIVPCEECSTNSCSKMVASILLDFGRGHNGTVPTYRYLYFGFYKVVSTSILRFILPVFIIAILTVRMVHSIRKAALLRERMGSTVEHASRRSLLVPQSQRFDATNRCLIAVVIKFLVCYSLPIILVFVEFAMLENRAMHYLYEISNVLVVLNSSCNFVIYFFSGSKFRRECYAYMCFKVRTTTEAPRSRTSITESSIFQHDCNSPNLSLNHVPRNSLASNGETAKRNRLCIPEPSMGGKFSANHITNESL